MELVDIGVNLGHNSFRRDLSAVMTRALEAGVVQMVVTGTDREESLRAAELAAGFPTVLYSTAGTHPHHASEWSGASARTLADLVGQAPVVAIGETGLDFYRNYSPRSDQERAFAAQLELAADLRLPVFLHERGAHARFIAILSRYRDRLPRAVLHCFTGSREELAVCLDLDLHVGITGWICDERRGLHLRELVPLMPEDRLMLETDAPYILPRTIEPRPKDRRNEPAYLTYVLATVAQSLGRPPVAVAEATTRTAREFFGLAVDG
jgi:TatD DNase family protein